LQRVWNIRVVRSGNSRSSFAASDGKEDFMKYPVYIEQSGRQWQVTVEARGVKSAYEKARKQVGTGTIKVGEKPSWYAKGDVC
jgi:hypothetical protein